MSLHPQRTCEQLHDSGRSGPQAQRTLRYRRRLQNEKKEGLASRLLVQIGVVRGTDVGKATRANPCQRQEHFFLARNQLLDAWLLGTHALPTRLLLFTTKCHSCPRCRSIAARLKRSTTRAARRRAIRRRSDSMSSTLPCRWTETSPVNPFNREEGINNPSLVCRSLLKTIASKRALKNSRVSR